MPITPPDWVRDWLLLLTPMLTAAGVIIPAMRRWLVGPIIKTMREHAEQHDRMEHELALNGSDLLLPLGERSLSLRTLVILNRVSHLAHLAESQPLMDQYRREIAEREARGGD